VVREGEREREEREACVQGVGFGFALTISSISIILSISDMYDCSSLMRAMIWQRAIACHQCAPRWQHAVEIPSRFAWQGTILSWEQTQKVGIQGAPRKSYPSPTIRVVNTGCLVLGAAARSLPPHLLLVSRIPLELDDEVRHLCC
jgi:hypothetical protein